MAGLLLLSVVCLTGHSVPGVWGPYLIGGQAFLWYFNLPQFRLLLLCWLGLFPVADFYKCLLICNHLIYR